MPENVQLFGWLCDGDGDGRCFCFCWCRCCSWFSFSIPDSIYVCVCHIRFFFPLLRLHYLNLSPEFPFSARSPLASRSHPNRYSCTFRMSSSSSCAPNIYLWFRSATNVIFPFLKRFSPNEFKATFSISLRCFFDNCSLNYCLLFCHRFDNCCHFFTFLRWNFPICGISCFVVLNGSQTRWFDKIRSILKPVQAEVMRRSPFDITSNRLGAWVTASLKSSLHSDRHSI